ncbi:MAG: RagB/SusD family nutrient uptake outer membrane protein [Bacteroides sp.]|nr:RagB/SusD family nutrient uptake outer membrane protein [Bacteroides sp.]
MMNKCLHSMKIACLRMMVIVTLLFSASGCNDFFDVDSRHAASEEQQWQTMEDTRAALMGVYGLMRAALADNNTHWVCGELRGGDFTVVERADLQAVVDNNLSLNIGLVEEVADWRRFYAVINAAAVFMENASQVVENDQAYSELNLQYDLAQAHALRALAYFYMVRIWGDVPLITYSYDDGSFPEAGRTDAQDVLAYVKEELVNAMDDIPYLFGTDNNLYYQEDDSEWQGVLLNKLSVAAILAHVSMLMGNYSDAETYATFVLENYTEIGITEARKIVPVDVLVSSTGFFLGSNTTYAPNRLVAFNFLDASSETTQEGHLEQWTLADPYVQKTAPEIYVTADTLFKAFDDTGDQRFGIDTTTVQYNNVYVDMTSSRPLFKKICVVQDGSDDTNDYAVFGSTLVFTRIEELILLRAEALVMENRAVEALLDLNEMRSERGLTQLSYVKDLDSDKNKLIDAIFAERRRELMGEGWRWYDLIRRQKLLQDDSDFLQFIKEGGEYWPIAQSVLKANPNITQNKYWSN